jgi:CRISPR-associated protein Csx17
MRHAIGIAQRVAHDQRVYGWDKNRIVQEFRNNCPDELLPWIDAAVVLAGQQPYFPPLLGTGGNDGRLDFSTNFHQCLVDLLDESDKGRARSLAWARDLLAGTQAERLSTATVGQFDPVLAGGQGSSPFGAAGSLVNPWEYVLLVEGALLFASGTARRHQHDVGRAARPFTVSFSPEGTASGAAGEESRGEVWVPLWHSLCTLPEVKQLFGEARASWRGRPAQQAVEFYAATRTLGVARGIDEFVRYGLQRRNGLAFVAVPLERVQVRERPEVRLAARIEDWVSFVRRLESSAAVGHAVRQFDRAHMTYARDGGAIHLRDLLAALTTVEQAVGRSGRAKEKVPVRVLPRDGADFFSELAKVQQSRELRIAVGLASCACRDSTGALRTMRQILLPVDPSEHGSPRGRWREASVVPGFGLRPLRNVLADVLIWRSRTAATEPGAETFRGVPTFRSGVPVPAMDLHAFALSDVDEAELEVWLRACLAISWRFVSHPHWSAGESAGLLPVLGLLHPLAGGTGKQDDPQAPKLALGPDWAVRLAAGQIKSVHDDAARRLRQAGWNAVPPLDAPAGDGVALAAALVARCRGAESLLVKNFAVPLKEDPEHPHRVDHEINPPELAEEMS